MTRTTRLTPQFLAMSALLAWGLVPAELAAGMPTRVRDSLRNDLPNRADYDRIERSYYEQILDAGRQAYTSGEPVEVERERLTYRVADVREYALRPNMTTDPGRRIAWKTNAHGMRDREYPEAKPPDTFRVALVGDSIAAGWAVADGDGFEPRLEHAFDARSRAAGGPAVEFLNFAVPGHAPGQRWSHFEAIGWAFEPDMMVYEASTADPGWDERRLRVLLPKGIGFDAPVYRDALASSGLKPGLDGADYKRILKPLRWELLAGVYRTAAAECRSRGVPAVFVLIPRVGKPIDPADRRKILALASEAGFSAVVDACDAYDGADAADLAVSPNDFHPNAEGHARLARVLEPALAARPEIARLWARAADSADEGAEPR